MKKTMTVSKSKTRLFKFIIFGFFGLLSFGIYYVYYHWKLSKMIGYDMVIMEGKALPDAPRFTNKEMMNLGWAHHDKDMPTSSYLNFEEKKKEGVTRVGFFGCSFVRGNEVADTLNYASLISKKFNLDTAQVEFINFGVGGYGIHQSYMLYEYIGRKYDLDMLIFNIFEGHADRDATFRYAGYYPYLHGRYIIDEQGELELKEVIGDDKISVYNKYAEFFPPYQYLKYDFACPNFLKPFFETRFNYFFYYRSNYPEMKEEIHDTYVLFAKQLIKEGKKVVYLANDDYVASLGDKFQHPDFHVGKVYMNDISRSCLLYQAPLCHFSGLGNDVRANVIASQLVGDTATVPYINYTRLSEEATDVEVDPSKKFEQGYFSIDDQGAFGTVVANGGTSKWKEQRYYTLSDSIIQGLVLVGGSLADPEFLQIDPKNLNKDCKECMVKLEFGPNEHEYVAVRFSSMNKYMSVIAGLDNEFRGMSDNAEGIGINSFLLSTDKQITSATLQIGEEIIPLTTQPYDGKIKLQLPTTIRLRSHLSEFIDVKKLETDRGTVYYNLVSQTDTTRVPVMGWEKKEVTVGEPFPEHFRLPKQSKI